MPAADRPVLLIEDDDDHAVLFETSFMDSGLRRKIVRAETLARGLDLITEIRPWVAVVDLGLPDSSGLESVTKLESRCPQTPFVVLTANSESLVSVKAIREGAQDYLVKGAFTPELMARSLEYAVERKRILLELRQRNRDVEAFAAIASHDLQSPMRQMGQFASLVRTELAGGISPDVEEWLSCIETGAVQLQSLVLDLLRFSRLGKEGLECESFDLAGAVEEARSRLADLAAATGAEVEHADLPDVHADRGLVTTLLQNLVGNGMKYVRGRAPRVRVTARLRDDETIVSVADNGIGIEPQHFERIFEPCQRNVGEAEFEGNGLGLATCQRIVEAHGGRIWVESEPGVGSVFHFTLPAGSPD